VLFQSKGDMWEGRADIIKRSRAETHRERDEMKMDHSDQSHPETDEQIHLA